MSRSSGLARRSSKTQTLYERERIPLVRDLLERFPLCWAAVKGVCTGYSVDVHEVVTRGRGGSITDPANCRTVCRACHDWIGAHPRLALEMGLVRSSWERDGLTSPAD
jgi:hypothetical protein